MCLSISYMSTDRFCMHARAYLETITLSLHTCYGEVYDNIAQKENGWLSCGKLIVLLTFEQSSFWENGILVLHNFSRCSCWYLLLNTKSMRGQNREVDAQTDTQTDTQDNYRNPHCACTLRVNENSLSWLGYSCWLFSFCNSKWVG